MRAPTSTASMSSSELRRSSRRSRLSTTMRKMVWERLERSFISVAPTDRFLSPFLAADRIWRGCVIMTSFGAGWRCTPFFTLSWTFSSGVSGCSRSRMRSL